MKTITLKVTPITADKLKTIMDAGWWATKANICKGVNASAPAPRRLPVTVIGRSEPMRPALADPPRAQGRFSCLTGGASDD